MKATDYCRDPNYSLDPLSDEEMDLLAAERADALGWEGMEALPDDSPHALVIRFGARI